jgi:hypothetical protein
MGKRRDAGAGHMDTALPDDGSGAFCQYLYFN